MKPRTLLIGILIAATVQTGVLAKIITDRAARLQSGQEILVETGFIDPRDLFRGHYTILNLLISNIPAKDVKVIGKIEWYAPVYVELDTSGEFAKPTILHATIPQNPNGPVLKGRANFNTQSAPDRYQIDFPFNRFFAAKDRALELQNLQRDRKLGVILSLANDGTALIKGLTIEGKKLYEEPLY